jgi:aspartyl/asparaginyl beta-hydroxylase (cupin superfamily)
MAIIKSIPPPEAKRERKHRVRKLIKKMMKQLPSIPKGSPLCDIFSFELATTLKHKQATINQKNIKKKV